MISNKKKIFICATEQSGDNIGYSIMRELLKGNDRIIFDGVGGSQMNTLMKNQFFHIKDFNTMGIFEIIFSLKKYFNMINYLVQKVKNNNYDIIITIDSPDFNYPLCKKIKKINSFINLIHIVAPSVWAWRPKRANKFANIFNELMVLYKFESKYFTKYNLKTTFIGQPIFYINSKIDNLSHKNNIAFLPGSRMSEIKKLLPYFTIAYEYIFKNFPELNIFIPTLPHLEKYIQDHTKYWKVNVIITTNLNDIDLLFSSTSSALVCSGTASLEIAKRNIPQLVIYKLNFLTELIGKLIIKVKYANLLNIVSNKMIIPEIKNSDLNPKDFIIKFKQLILNKNNINQKQIEEVNTVLELFKSSLPPYVIAAKRINHYLN